MNSLTPSAQKVVRREPPQIERVREVVARWEDGWAIGGDVCNAVFAAIEAEPFEETVAEVIALMTPRLREDMIDYLAGFRGRKPSEISSISSVTRGIPAQASPVEQSTLDAIERWFASR